MDDFTKDGIRIISVENILEGEDFVKELLYKNSDPKTVLFLSGGKTPKALYNQLLLEARLVYGAVGMIDERYGKIGHERSNALIMDKFSPFYPILNSETLEKTALQYDETARYLFNYFQKSIGLLGIGSDGHTAGIPAIPQIADKILENRSDLVTFYDAKDGFYNERITFTFNAIRKLDQIIIMAFGEDKKFALEMVFKEGPIVETPARFYKDPEIARKTILITDQKM